MNYCFCQNFQITLTVKITYTGFSVTNRILERRARHHQSGVPHKKNFHEHAMTRSLKKFCTKHKKNVRTFFGGKEFVLAPGGGKEPYWVVQHKWGIKVLEGDAYLLLIKPPTPDDPSQMYELPILKLRGRQTTQSRDFIHVSRRVRIK
jgi:hypothetical protein